MTDPRIDILAAALAAEQWDGRCIIGNREVVMADPMFEQRRDGCRDKARDLLARLDGEAP